MALSTSQLVRYSRQMIIDKIGQNGQEKLLSSKVLVVGAGGLGSPVLLYLAAAGIGHIGIADSDIVELSNLQRQVIFSQKDLKSPKAEMAALRVMELNPDVKTETHPFRVEKSNAEELFSRYDLVIDASDTFLSKFLINDVCVGLKKPFVHGGILQLSGQVLSWKEGHACYRCVFDQEPAEGAIPSCVEAGVLGAVAGLIGSVQAAEAIKLLLNSGDPLLDRMFVADIWSMKTRTVPVKRNASCLACSSIKNRSNHE